ncbi:Pentatricopeptide repeat-containing protein [Quillaja saponaria]|uniref:Pentatricopeptide repeat-containing protein n=1 Tax=Quillaja saponaria TaxID=32244 RepID=A0AAD7LTN8_QUISA|nr:Pentatricopeptide repeat-containing protein [Quillaja saponaria]
MSCSIPLSAPQPAHLNVLPNLVPCQNTATLSPPTNLPPNEYYGKKLIKSTPTAEICEPSKIQPLIDLLRGCEGNGSLKQAKAIHGCALKSNFQDRDLLILLNHLAHVYSKCSGYNDACRVFDEMPQRNVFSWTVMIVGSNENSLYLKGVDFFCMMINQRVLPDGFAYSTVLQSCIGLDCPELGKMVHAQIVVSGFLSHTVVSTSLLNMYAKLGKIEDSYKVFNTMIEHNTVSWNAMISGFTLNGLHLEAFDSFLKMNSKGIIPNIFTLISVSKAVGKFGDVNKCNEVHRYASKLGMNSNVMVGTALIDMYSKCGFPGDARFIFETFACCEVNTPWNAMITGYSQCGCNKEALELFVRMCKNGVKPDVYTFCSVSNATAALKYLDFIREIHGMVLKCGFDSMVISVSNAIADAYAKSGSLEDVKKVFARMEERDIVSWTTLVTAYCQCSEWEKALAIFTQMQKEGVTPNHFTFSSVPCFMCYPLLAGVWSADSWPLMQAYAQHGLVEDAIQLFREMEQLGAEINAVTFLCVLFACSHAGRVGRLDDAVEFIRSMPVEPNEMIWQTLLGACRTHGNAELGEIAAQKILSVCPEHPATYVLLSNTYIESGLYEDGVNLRDAMKACGIKKEPGYSWISMRGRVYKFYAGDQQHPQKDEIYAMLEQIIGSVLDGLPEMESSDASWSFFLLVNSDSSGWKKECFSSVSCH